MAGYMDKDVLQGLMNSYKKIPRENEKKNFSQNRENDVIYLRAMDNNCPTDIIVQIASRIDKDKLWGEDITTISLAIPSVEEKDISLTVIMYSILDYLKSCGCSVKEIKEMSIGTLLKIAQTSAGHLNAYEIADEVIDIIKKDYFSIVGNKTEKNVQKDKFRKEDHAIQDMHKLLNYIEKKIKGSLAEQDQKEIEDNLENWKKSIEILKKNI